MDMETAIAYLENGKKPMNTPGLNFYDTGATLVTANRVAEIDSMSVEEARNQCWN